MRSKLLIFFVCPLHQREIYTLGDYVLCVLPLGIWKMYLRFGYDGKKLVKRGVYIKREVECIIIYLEIKIEYPLSSRFAL
jgi:hypothetical protein